MTAWYNEHDRDKAAWLRELIKRGLIAAGDVDERSIADVEPGELVGYTQCHFFAGIGVWSYALRCAGWTDDRPVWTGSCPCPGFSVAGKGGGFTDPRHLWPVWFNLIRECGPGTVFGEQADGAIGHGWLDLVSTDVEAEGYAFAAAILGACGVGAPHRRYRLYFCADSESRRLEQLKTASREMPSLLAEAPGAGKCVQPTGGCGSSIIAGSSAEAMHTEWGTEHIDRSDGRDREDSGRQEAFGESGARSQVCIGPNADGGHAAQPSESGVEIDAKREGLEGHFGDVREWRGPGWLDPLTARSVAEAGATRGFWADCDWWYGRDGKYRPIGPEIQPLASGATARMVRLRGYGDAIVAPVAQAFIEAYIDIFRISAE